MSREQQLRDELKQIEAQREKDKWGKCLSCVHYKPHELQVAYQCAEHKTKSSDGYWTDFEATCAEWPSIKKMTNKYKGRK